MESLINRINRNIVECKYLYGLAPVGAYEVLIETLWNVNVGVVLVVDLSVSY